MRLKRTKKKESCPQDILIKRQAERIEELRKQNGELTAKLEEYRKSEKEITDAVLFAKAKQDEYLSDLRVRYALENERLRRFCEKMDCYKSREELLRAYDDSFSAVKKAREELDRVLKEDLGAGTADYLSERKRLGLKDEAPFITTESMVRSDLNKVSALTEEELQELLDQI